ncbi:MAG: histone deacetylase [Chloroflexota bacterium]
MKVGYVYSPIYLRHDTGTHVENARRLEAVTAYLEESGLREQLTLIEPRPATVAEVATVHDRRYIDYVREAAQRGGGWLDPDTVVSPESYEVALYAAGGAIRAVDAVLGGEVDSAFALVRPPGHHATARQAMGFCLFNNLAVATKYAQKQAGVERIAIIDFDVHHGNGTQEAFYADPQVLYISMHQSHHFPGTGAIGETGAGEGVGATLNVPLPAGCGDAEYGQVFREIVIPAARRFQPGLVMVSAGYDAHWTDNLAFMQVNLAGFMTMVRMIRELAEEVCRGKVVLCLEGGYHPRALAECVGATLQVLRGRTVVPDTLGKPERMLTAPAIGSLLQEVKRVHGLP